MSTIHSIEIFPVGVPVTRDFVFASGRAGAAGSRAGLILVRVRDEHGREGWGQSRPVPSWSYETIESATAVLRHHLVPAVLGHSVWDRRGLHQRMFASIGRGPSDGMPIAKAALDIAVHDLLGKTVQQPLRSLLGGDPAPTSLPLSWTCTAHTVEDIERDVAEGLALGLRHFNFKAGVTPGTDIAVARALAAIVPQGSFLWADCNQGFSIPDAVRVAHAFEELGVDLLEQPLPADQLHLLETLRARTRLPLAVDEASVSAGDFFNYARKGLVDYLVLKVTRSGGIWPSLLQLSTARSAGLPFVVSGLTDGLLTKLAAAQLAAAFGNQRPLALNGSQFLDESELFPTKADWEHDGAVHLGSQHGVGPAPDLAAVKDAMLPL
jgi:L-alanine-DL-glutamate epimerase-like enolase superfamily enzyme